MSASRRVVRSAIVFGAYGAALLAASAAVAINVAATSGPDRQGASGMYAFGDGIAFFLAGLVAPTRPDRVALLVATGMEALAFGAIALTWAFSVR